MALSKEEKKRLVEKFGDRESDCGSVSVQIALLTLSIKSLMLHFKKNTKDLHSKHGLLKKVARRRKFLKYLKQTSSERYYSLIQELAIRDVV